MNHTVTRTALLVAALGAASTTLAQTTATPTTLRPTTPVGQVLFATPGVSILTPTGDSRPATRGDVLRAGERVVTRSGALGQVVLRDGGLVGIRPGSELTFEPPATSGAPIVLTLGSGNVRLINLKGPVSEAPAPQPMLLKTPDGQVQVASADVQAAITSGPQTGAGEPARTVVKLERGESVAVNASGDRIPMRPGQPLAVARDAVQRLEGSAAAAVLPSIEARFDAVDSKLAKTPAGIRSQVASSGAALDTSRLPPLGADLVRRSPLASLGRGELVANTRDNVIGNLPRREPVLPTVQQSIKSNPTGFRENFAIIVPPDTPIERPVASSFSLINNTSLTGISTTTTSGVSTTGSTSVTTTTFTRTPSIGLTTTPTTSTSTTTTTRSTTTLTLDSDSLGQTTTSPTLRVKSGSLSPTLLQSPITTLRR